MSLIAAWTEQDNTEVDDFSSAKIQLLKTNTIFIDAFPSRNLQVINHLAHSP